MEEIVQSPKIMDFKDHITFAQQLGLEPGPGRRRALLIGIRYWRDEDKDNVLKGAYADIDDMQHLLMENFGWSRDEFTVLKDDLIQPGSQPTRDIVLREMGNLVKGARPGDQLFFHFAGHGGQVMDDDGDEYDDLDEVIKTSDGHIIVDDEMFNILVKPLPRGCRLTAVFDCCNSGTGLDLPEIVKTPPIVRRPSRTPSPTPSMMKARRMRPRAPFRRLTSSREVPRVDVTTARPIPTRKDSDGDVILWSACQDNEAAYEKKIGETIRGVMTYNFISALRAKQHTYQSLLDELCVKLPEMCKNVQTPQLSASQPIPMETLISI
ncbi:peptidase C14 [Exidia glandulosa HHB12029]|uniref:Peptidase C14 n=1 Tax=Exidia glandulosa HHB12029 TaxID=1314781 RepID=A0A165LHS7_EXIGL|nr:peptidase C14 [Exidia glandulosa HHB12029]